MEIGLESRIPTYSGGLGILAGDMAHSFADLGIQATFVTLLSRNGYAYQKLRSDSGQDDSPNPWEWKSILTRAEPVVKVEIGEKAQTVGAWEYKLKGKSEVTVLFLDTDFPENEQQVRLATDRLYGGDQSTRLIQDMVLGVGGYRILKALGQDVHVYHLNESHAAFAMVELLRDSGAEGARRMGVFTTHTPIAAGNDAFPVSWVRNSFLRYPWVRWENEAIEGLVRLSRLAAKYCGVTNAVSLKHSYVSREVVGKHQIEYVTNGVYHRRWVHPEMKKVYDKHLQGWEESPSLLARAYSIPSDELSSAHSAAKEELVAMVHERSGISLDASALLITVAKRFTSYKRNGMILGDPEKLGKIGTTTGKVQVILAGKAHPKDQTAKEMIADTIKKAEYSNGNGNGAKVAIIENYDIDAAKLLVAGSDVWLNNPKRPLEACGTSGMKAAMNGVLNFSVYDGWWLEAGVDGVNGWGIGRKTPWEDLGGPSDGEDERNLYDKLAASVVPAFYGDRGRWMEMSKASISTAGPVFNSYRMIENYVARVYSRALEIS